MWLNQSDIEGLASRTHSCPNVRKGVRLLHRLMQAVNAQSDGWAYWTAPSRSAEPLVKLLQTAGNLAHDTRGTISAADLRKAVAPIKSMVTRQQRMQARYGNKFEFDVDEALRE